MGFYNRVTGSTGNEMRIKEPKPFKPIELEQLSEGLTDPIGLIEETIITKNDLILNSTPENRL